MNRPRGATDRDHATTSCSSIAQCRRNSTAEYRAVMAGIWAVCGLSAVSSVVPTVDRVLTLVAVAIGLVWLAVAALRRELRIRCRLAAIQPIAAVRASEHTSARSLANTTATNSGDTR